MSPRALHASAGSRATRRDAVARVLGCALLAAATASACGWFAPEPPPAAPSPPAPAQLEPVVPAPPPPPAPEPEPPPAPLAELVPLAPAPPPVIVVRETRGRVETRRGGNWQPVNPGHILAVEEPLRTARGAHATVAAGETITLDIGERTELAVRTASGASVRVRLERGRVRAGVGGTARAPLDGGAPGASPESRGAAEGGAEAEDGGAADDGALAEVEPELHVESAGSTAVANARAGTFSVFNDGAGLVAVAAATGGVKLLTDAGATDVAAGEQATVTAGEEAPEKEEIPSRVFLSVAWPAEKETRAETLVLTGRVDAGTEVVVNGVAAAVGPDGSFEATIALAEGAQDVEVRGIDPLGREQAESTRLDVRRTAPAVQVDRKGLWR